MYKTIVGLEAHIELKTQSKMFCDCLNSPMAQEPNIYICPICTGQPGSLPVINQKAVEYVLKTALALNCQIPEFSKFDRKNYFYPDLPKGYQISQFDKPLSVNGFLDIYENSRRDSRQFARIRIRRIHLEEDTGKLIHSSGADYSLVDFNRAGVPLMELVTEPDIAFSQEARKFAQELQMILRYLDVSDADMEKGEMRVEANISLAPTVVANEAKQSRGKQNSAAGLPRGFAFRNDSIKLGTKVEIKNLNSFRAVERAIEYEIQRQADLLEAGEKIVQETRGWDENKQKTFSQRAKEEAEDYRYFPEPDLPPLSLDKAYIESVKSKLPELPQDRRKRFEEEFKLPAQDINVLTANKNLADYFEQVCSEFSQTEEFRKDLSLKKLYKLAVNYLLTEIPRAADKLQIINYKLSEKITPENFAEFIVLIQKGDISSSGAQAVLEEMFKTGADPTHIIEDKGLKQMSDEAELMEIAKEVIKDNPEPARDYQSGKENALQFLVGKIMAATKGKANPALASGLLKKLLTE